MVESLPSSLLALPKSPALGSAFSFLYLYKDTMVFVRMSTVSPAQKVVATLVAFVMLVLGLMFSVVVVPVILVLGLAGFGYLHWKTRALRKAMKQAVRDASVIEGEATVIHEHDQVTYLG